MPTTKEVRHALLESLQRAPDLRSVEKWHLVDGFEPSRKHPTGFIGSGTTTYDLQDEDWDLATTELPVIFCVMDPDPVRGEDRVQELAEAARLHLVVDDPTLNGVVQRVDVQRLVFDTAEADGHLLAHFATLQVAATYFVPRFRQPAEPLPEEIEISVEGEG